jgi:predicted secreted Zn-dependent protease
MHRLLITLMPAVIAFAGCRMTVPGASAPPPLPFGARAQVVEQPYDVHGLTHLEITRSLNEGARTNIRGGFRGYHQWNIRWQFRYAPSARGCDITSSSVDLESATTLPRWVDRDRADSALVAEWDRYIGALRIHENGHRDIAHRAAGEIQRTLRRFSAGTCASISSHANRVARDILERHRRENSEYDEETRHGATQGASWQARGRITALSAPALLTAARGVFEEPDDAGGWRTVRVFALSGVLPAEPEPGTSDPSFTPRVALR